MPHEALSYGDRRLDAEIDRLWAAIEALRAAPGGTGEVRAYTEAIVFTGETPGPGPVVGGSIRVAELDGDPEYEATGILVDQSDGLSVGYDEDQGLPILQADVVQTLAAEGESGLTGDVTVSEGANISLTQAGQDIEIAVSDVVTSLAAEGELGLTGAVTISEGANIGMTQAGQDIEIAVEDVVTSVAAEGEGGLTGAVTFSEGANITLTQAGQDIEIAATGSGLGLPVTYIGIGNSDDDPYVMTAPAAEGVICIKNIDSEHVLRVQPPASHYIVDNNYFGHNGAGGGRLTHYLPPGWSVGFYYPGSGVTWRCIWLWQPTHGQLQFAWSQFGGGYYNEIPEPEVVVRYGKMELNDGTYTINGKMLLLPMPTGRSLMAMAGLFAPATI